MSGTDVAQEGADKAAEAPKGNSPFLTYLKIWLPFPLMLGAMVWWQVRSGMFEKPAPPPDEVASVLEGAGAEVPVLLSTLQRERDKLAVEWDELRAARKRVLLEQGEIDTRQKEVEALLARVDEKLRGASAEKAQTFDQLAKVYETMKPDAAAGILGDMDLETATEVLRRMKERNAAEILARFDPARAAEVSKRMLRAS